ncbi:MAG: TCP-1/cpn60 chaperonin family protein [Gallionella sp.]|nr:TCP-1/cpn60 chaperonin family protein [Gallionella sp.]
MARVITDQCVARLIGESMAPMLRAIGLSLGPDGAGVLTADGPTGRHPSTGVAIARALVGEAGAHDILPRLLTEELVAFERDFGDGTAQFALLAGSLVQAGLRYGQGGRNTTALAHSYVATARSVGDQLRALVTTDFDPADVARSAGASAATACLLADALQSASDPGAIEVIISSRESGIRVSPKAGFAFDAAAAVPRSGVATLSDPHFLVADESISDFGTLVKVVDGFVERRKSLVIVAREIAGAALATLQCNQSTEHFSVLALTPADAGPRAAAVLEDLAVATGAELVADRLGNSLAHVRPHMLGRARLISFEGGRAVLAEPQGERCALAQRRAALRDEIAGSRYLSYDLEHAQRRLARLDGNWCEVVVGADDSMVAESAAGVVRRALAATRWALLHGVVPGGGLALDQVGRKMLSQSPGDHAQAAVARALMGIRRHIVAGKRADSGSNVLDPSHLVIELVARAFSFAGSVLQTGAFVCR